MTYEYRLSAVALTGELYWPMGAKAYKEVSSLTWREPRVHSPDKADPAVVTLRDLTETLLASEGGDFSTAPLLAEPWLEVRKYRADGSGYRSRTFDLANARTIADYVDRDWTGFPLAEWEQDALDNHDARKGGDE